MNSFKKFEEVLDLVPHNLPVPKDDETKHKYVIEEMKKISLIQPMFFYCRRGVCENIKHHIYKNSFSRCLNKIDEPAVVNLYYRYFKD